MEGSSYRESTVWVSLAAYDCIQQNKKVIKRVFRMYIEK